MIHTMINGIGANNLMVIFCAICLAVLIDNTFKISDIENEHEVINKDFFMPILYFIWYTLRRVCAIIQVIILPLVIIAKNRRVVGPEAEFILKFNEKLSRVVNTPSMKGVVKLYPIFIKVALTYIIILIYILICNFWFI